MAYVLLSQLLWNKNVYYIYIYKHIYIHAQKCRVRYYQTICYAKSLQSCPTLWDPIDDSPTGSPIPGILQARTLEWAAISFSNAWKWKVKVKLLSCVWPAATPWTAALQAPPSMGFTRQEYWSGVPLPSLTKLYKSCFTLEEIIIWDISILCFILS